MIKINPKVKFDVEKARRAILEHRAAGVKRLADYVAEMARVFCPVDTGDLQRSITVVPAGPLKWIVIVPMPYADAVEFGHINVRSGMMVPPNPFLRKALRLGALKFPEYVGKSEVKEGFSSGSALSVRFAA